MITKEAQTALDEMVEKADLVVDQWQKSEDRTRINPMAWFDYGMPSRCEKS